MKHLQLMIREFLDARGWRERATPGSYAKSVAIEAAELLELFQWNEPSVADVKRDPKLLGKIRHELADVLIYALDLADILDLDAEEVIEEKMAHNARKYPVDTITSDPASYQRIKDAYRDIARREL